MDAGAPWERVRAALSELRSPGERAAVLDSLAPGALRVVIATDSGVDANIVVAIRRYLDHDRAVAPSLDGAALQAMGCPEGPALGEILRALRVARIDEVTVDRAAEEVLARRLIEARAN